jgi:murein DD-endopeptidase MepM/ murein hydrolase activator NlpD
MSTLYVTAGQHVDGGQTIGLCDNTGNSSGCHLHFEVKSGGSYVNPWTVLP